MAHGLYLRQIEVGRNDTAKRLQLLLREVVLATVTVVFVDLARRRTSLSMSSVPCAPCRRPHADRSTPPPYAYAL